MVRQPADEALGVTTLVTGTNEFLAERVIAGIRRAVTDLDADADISELAAQELGPGALAEIASPSLFASMRCVVVWMDCSSCRRISTTGFCRQACGHRNPVPSRC